MSDLIKSLDFVFINEGGYSNHPNDNGGATMMGITSSTLSNAYSKGIVSHNNIKKLTKDQAKKIYEILYWKPALGELLPYPLNTIVFDAAVNHGVKSAIKMLQRTLNTFGNSLTVDGLVGPQTKKTISKVLATQDLRKIGLEFIDQRRSVYYQIVNNNPKQKVFLKGWLNRINRNINYLDRNLIG